VGVTSPAASTWRHIPQLVRRRRPLLPVRRAELLDAVRVVDLRRVPAQPRQSTSIRPAATNSRRMVQTRVVASTQLVTYQYRYQYSSLMYQ